MTPKPVSPQQDAIDVFGRLHMRIHKAIEDCMDDAALDRLRVANESVAAVLTALNREDFHARTADFATVASTMKAATDQLEKLKEDIDRVIQDVALASEVAGGIEAALNAASGLRVL